MLADIVVDLQYGDCGKGKVAYNLCRTKKYSHVIRYNGGCNAGHTIYHKGEKLITHHVPVGVFFGIPSIIGSGCVVDPVRLKKELEDLANAGANTKLLSIAHNAHLIMEKHLEEDAKDPGNLGTTKRGNGPAYRDKYDRSGFRAEHFDNLPATTVDLYRELHKTDENVRILFEGAQGFGLDIDWGDYPYVTSSHCTSGSAIMNGIPPQAVGDVWGVAKIYETYVGTKDFHGKGDVFTKIQEVGQEYGATTGRPRQCNWLNWNQLEKAIALNGVTKLVFNKVDILREVGQWAVINNNEVMEFDSEANMTSWLKSRLTELALKYGLLTEVIFSDNPDTL